MTSYYAQCPDFDGTQHYGCARTPEPMPSNEERIQFWLEHGLTGAHPEHCHFDVDLTALAAEPDNWATREIRRRLLTHDNHIRGGNIGWYPSNDHTVALFQRILTCTTHKTHAKIWRRATAYDTRHHQGLLKTWERVQMPVDPNNELRWRPHYWALKDTTTTLQHVW